MATAQSKGTELAATADPLTGEVMPFEATALQAASAYGMEYRVSDLIRTPAEWEEFDQVNLDEWCNFDVIIHDAMFFESNDYQNDNGSAREWCIIKFEDPQSHRMMTTATGGMVVVRKLHQLMAYKVRGEERNLLPCVGQFRRHESSRKGASDYFDLV